MNLLGNRNTWGTGLTKPTKKEIRVRRKSACLFFSDFNAAAVEEGKIQEINY